MPNIPTDKKLYMKVKLQAKKLFKVWPSAYASGWLVKTYKKLGGKYSVSESTKNIKSLKLRVRKSSSRKSRSRKSSSRKSRVRKSSSRKSRSRKSSSRKSSSRKSRSRKSRSRKSSSRKSRVRKSRVRKSSSRKSRVRKSRVRKSSSRKSRVRKSRVRKSSSRKSRSRKSRSRKSITGLDRWFKEDWVDVCELPRIVKCGRNNASKSNRDYPYCRPLNKVTSKSPVSAMMLSSQEINKRCKQKRKYPDKKLFKSFQRS
jgi:hypothetical protein